MFPVWTIASRDESLPAVVDAAARVREAGATLVASGNAAEEIEGAAHVLPVPSRRTRFCAAPFRRSRAALPGALAQAKGLDADFPTGLTKVTRAR